MVMDGVRVCLDVFWLEDVVSASAPVSRSLSETVRPSTSGSRVLGEGSPCLFSGGWGQALKPGSFGDDGLGGRSR